MAAGRAHPLGLSARAAGPTAGAALAVVLALGPGDGSAGVVLLALAGLGCWVAGALRRDAGRVATGVALVGVEAVVAVALVEDPPVAVALAGAALLLAGEATLLAVELPPALAIEPGALARRARVVAGLAVGGAVAGVLVLGAADAGIDGGAALTAAGALAVAALGLATARAARP